LHSGVRGSWCSCSHCSWCERADFDSRDSGGILETQGHRDTKAPRRKIPGRTRELISPGLTWNFPPLCLCVSVFLTYVTSGSTDYFLPNDALMSATDVNRSGFNAWIDMIRST